MKDNSRETTKENKVGEMAETAADFQRDEEHWYVLRVTYQRELVARNFLTKEGVRSYVPVKVDKHEQTYKETPILHNYIFVYSTFNEIMDIKQYKLPYLRYVMSMKEGKERIPLIVPNWQMENFLLVTGANDEGIEFYNPKVVDMSKGDRVRILGGAFEGVEGIIVKLKNEKRSRVVVQLDTLLGVATSTISPELIEKL